MSGALRENAVILIVDNNLEGRESLRRLLSRVGYRVESVGAGQEALDYLRAVCPKLVILDVTDALGVGLDVLREIRRDELMADLPVVVRTTGDNSAAQQEADRLGIYAHFPEGDGDLIGLLSRVGDVCEPALPSAMAE